MVAFLALLVSHFPFAFGSTVPLQDSIGSRQSMKPYTVVHFPKSMGLQNTVVEGFEFGCPYCRRMNDPLISWASTLPKPFTFTQMPVLIAKRYYSMTIATFAVYESDPNLIQAFETNAFNEVLTNHEPLNNFRVYMIAAAKAGVSYHRFLHALKSPAVAQLSVEDARIMRIAHITHTPSLIICGRYVINPGDTKGNDGMFIKLANALVSRCIYDKKDS